MSRIVRVLVLLALAAIPAVAVSAQEEVTRIYVAYFQIRYGDLEEWIESYQQNSAPVLQAMVDAGSISGFGAHMHNTGGEYNIRQVMRGTTDTNWDAAWDEYLGGLTTRNPAAAERGNRMILAHEDEIWNIDAINAPNPGRYFYDAQFQVNFADLEAWNAMLAETMLPVLDKAVADGLISGWVQESHNTGGRFTSKLILMSDEWDTLDDVQALMLEAAPLSHPMWDMFTAHRDELWEAVPAAGGN